MEMRGAMLRPGRYADREPSSRLGLPHTAYSVLHTYRHLAKKQVLFAVRKQSKMVEYKMSFLLTYDYMLFDQLCLFTPTVRKLRQQPKKHQTMTKISNRKA